ncbi:MAG: hypothetical protein IKQ77_13700 [Prevotella sp.]|nr:hypothetical protein [Prevotella sp.]
MNAAIADGAHIRLTGDITLSAYLKIGQNATQTIVIDLNSHTLKRTGLSSANANGHVIEVFGKGTLTLQNGTLTGGYANNGGGICNYGTVTLENVTIDKCIVCRRHPDHQLHGGRWHRGWQAIPRQVEQ